MKASSVKSSRIGGCAFVSSGLKKRSDTNALLPCRLSFRYSLLRLNVSCIPAVSRNRKPTSLGNPVATTSTSISLSAFASPLATEPKKQIETKRSPKNSRVARTYPSATARYSCCNHAHPTSLGMKSAPINPTCEGAMQDYRFQVVQILGPQRLKVYLSRKADKASRLVFDETSFSSLCVW